MLGTAIDLECGLVPASEDTLSLFTGNVSSCYAESLRDGSTGHPDNDRMEIKVLCRCKGVRKDKVTWKVPYCCFRETDLRTDLIKGCCSKIIGVFKAV